MCMKKTGKSKRVNLSLPIAVLQIIVQLAKRDQVPVTTKAAQLVQQGLEVEDEAIAIEIAEQRLREIESGAVKPIKAADFWKLVESDHVSD